ncbi:DNA polymerase lambda [Mycena pura]|uniref:DNA polymerase lambda n=1 Tax=Mycena pura TaxID=153505 RepID=A0AAD7E2J9_9AGAR|nr:DNA polymerase lambda [Mycena pura]
MLKEDVEAFFREQDARMNEPEDDMDEYLARMAAMRRSPDPSFDTCDEPAQWDDASHAPSDASNKPASTTRREGSSELVPPPTFKQTAGDVAQEDVPMRSVTPTFPRSIQPVPSPASMRASPSPPTVIDHQPRPTLKRKESPTKPDKPLRKKAAIDTHVSPPQTTSEPSKKPKSTTKAVRPIIQIPPPPVPENLSSSPIEEPNFSVVVSRFEPAATSTQPPKLAAEPSAFQLMLQRTENHARMKRERKLLKAGVKDSASSKARSSSIESSDIISVSSSSRPASPEPARQPPAPSTKPKPKTKVPAHDPPKPAPPKKNAKGKKERVKMYPKDYAQMLNDKLNEPADPKAKPCRKFLAGKTIFYVGGEMTWASETTKGRMEIIVKHGGTLLPVFDAERVTHVVSEAAMHATLRALSVTRLSQLPEHVPVVRWDWVVTGFSGKLGPLFEYAAFSQRIPPIEMPARPAGSKGKGKDKQRAEPASNDDVSHISTFTQDKPAVDGSEDGREPEGDRGPLLSPPSSPHLKASASLVKVENKPADPLAEFYAQARAEREKDLADEDETDVDEVSDSDKEDTPNPGPPRKRGWTCDNKEAQRKDGPNEYIAKKLEELMLLHKAKPGDEDHWRAFSYQKCLRAIRNYPKRIKTIEQARSIRGVGDKTALKVPRWRSFSSACLLSDALQIMEIINTGDLRRIAYENTDDVKVRQIFQGIYGVGQSTAVKWYAAGCRTLEDLLAGKGGVELSPQQRIGIEFYDDINSRMPRAEVKALFELIKPIALNIDPKLDVRVMGSYRRGKADCGDIDIMITRDPADGRTHAGILHHLLKALHARQIITADLALPEDPFDLEAIYRGLCCLPDVRGARQRRIDFLTVPWTSRGAALLYYTGDDIFNRAMRLKANHLGYSLNQKGLFAGVVRDPRNRTIKLNTGNLVASETEEEIFRMLDVPFREPHERVRG